jgi:DNA-binding LacI/PurR family transcriptional regulator
LWRDLSAVAQVRYELGGQAVRLLINQIRGCPDECKEIMLPLELVIRASAP